VKKRILVIDIGGSNVKVMISRAQRRKFQSGPEMSPPDMVAQIESLVQDWTFEGIAMGFPSPVRNGCIICEPKHLGSGWTRFNFEKSLGKPVRIINDAAMQALGSYRSGKMLFLGLGTGLGAAMVAEGIVEPMELGHLPYKKSTYEDYVGRAGLKRHGKKKWRRHVADILTRLIAALQPDETVIGGGNAKKITALPPRARTGDNANALRGGFLLWHQTEPARSDAAAATPLNDQKG